LLHDPGTWGNKVKHQCQSACKKKGVVFRFLTVGTQSTKAFLANLDAILKQNLSERP